MIPSLATALASVPADVESLLAGLDGMRLVSYAGHYGP